MESTGYGMHVQYSYDARGNMVGKQESGGQAAQRTTNFQYDLLDRKISATDGFYLTYTRSDGTEGNAKASERWTYDVMGNQTSYTDAN
jgi:hypothetical protein